MGFWGFSLPLAESLRVGDTEESGDRRRGHRHDVRPQDGQRGGREARKGQVAAGIQGLAQAPQGAREGRQEGKGERWDLSATSQQ